MAGAEAKAQAVEGLVETEVAWLRLRMAVTNEKMIVTVQIFPALLEKRLVRAHSERRVADRTG